jgi:hypothetical protein
VTKEGGRNRRLVLFFPMREIGNAYKVLVENPEEKQPVRRLRHR